MEEENKRFSSPSPFVQRQPFSKGLASKEQTKVEMCKNYDYSSNSKLLGKGAFGRVALCSSKHDRNFKVAIKSQTKRDGAPERNKRITEEIAILSALDHPNIVKYYETYNDAEKTYFVMEYIEGMELKKKIENKSERITEKIAAKYM